MSGRWLTIKDWVWLSAPWLAGVAVVLAAALHFWQPAPPRTIVMATGAEGSATQRYGLRYKEVLARHGITLELRASTGALENRALLLNDDAKVAAAFLQTGSAGDEDKDWLAAIAGVYPEPLWVFYRSPRPYTQLSELAGKPLAIGSLGSGTRRLAVQLFAAYGYDIDAGPHVDSSGRAGAQLLLAGKVDGLMLVTGEDSDIVQQLLRAPGIRLLPFTQSAALSRRFPQLTAVNLAPGMIDLAKNQPPQDVPLLAAMSQLVVRSDLHPALTRLLAEAAREIHGGSGWFHKAGDFPTLKGTDVPISADAEHYFASGTGFLQRYLPFWFAVWAERLLIVLVPLLALSIPAMRILPVLYNWRMRSRIYRWYAEVRRLEEEMRISPPSAEAGATAMMALELIEQRAEKVRVPLSFARELYDLKEHIAFVRRKLAEAINPGK